MKILSRIKSLYPPMNHTKISQLRSMRQNSHICMVEHANAKLLVFTARKDLGKIMKILSIIETLMQTKTNLEMALMVK